MSVSGIDGSVDKENIRFAETKGTNQGTPSVDVCIACKPAKIVRLFHTISPPIKFSKVSSPINSVKFFLPSENYSSNRLGSSFINTEFSNVTIPSRNRSSPMYNLARFLIFVGANLSVYPK